MIVSVPPAAPAPWRWQDRVTWAATLGLAIFAYVGILLALAALRKIERQTQALEEAVESLSEHARAAMTTAQAVVAADRPWLLISIEASPTVSNGFNLVATNRGRTPAKIVAALALTALAADEADLPSHPDYRNEKKTTGPLLPVILVPGESIQIKAFSREQVPALCASEEQFRRIEAWEEKLFLYGRILYRDLATQDDRQERETAWCCWYIHGRQKSGLIFAGPPGYSLHT